MKTEFKTSYKREYVEPILKEWAEVGLIKINQVKCLEKETITLEDLFVDLPREFYYLWLTEKSGLTTNEKRRFAIYCAEFVLPMFEITFPDNKLPRRAIEAAKNMLVIQTESNKKHALSCARNAVNKRNDLPSARAAAYAVDSAISNGKRSYLAAFNADVATNFDEAFTKYVKEFIESILTKETTAHSTLEHELKTWPEYYDAVERGDKTFEIRFNDRGFEKGEILLLMEWDNKKEEYTGRWLRRKITYVLKGGSFGVSPEYVVMGISPLKHQ